MKIRQCKNCGNLFESIEGNICPACVEAIDNAFLRVRDYIYDHPKAGILEISKKTKVSEKLILQFLKDERLSVAESDGLLSCEKCAQPITTGRFCESCLALLNSDLERVKPATVPEPKPKQNPKDKMHLTYKL